MNLKWRLLVTTLVSTVLTSYVLSDYIGALIGISDKVMAWTIFLVGTGIALVSFFSLTAEALTIWYRWSKRTCIVIATLWVRQLWGTYLLDAPLFVLATDYSVDPPRIGYYLVYTLDNYRVARAVILDAPLLLFGVLTLGGFTEGSWAKHIVVFTAIIWFLGSLSWLAFPGAFNSMVGAAGFADTLERRKVWEAFDRSYEERIGELQRNLDSRLIPRLPAARGVNTHQADDTYWQTVAVIEKEIAGLREKKWLECKKLFPELCPEIERKKTSSATGKKVVPGNPRHVDLTGLTLDPRREELSGVRAVFRNVPALPHGSFGALYVIKNRGVLSLGPTNPEMRCSCLINEHRGQRHVVVDLVWGQPLTGEVVPDRRIEMFRCQSTTGQPAEIFIRTSPS